MTWKPCCLKDENGKDPGPGEDHFLIHFSCCWGRVPDIPYRGGSGMDGSFITVGQYPPLREPAQARRLYYLDL